MRKILLLISIIILSVLDLCLIILGLSNIDKWTTGLHLINIMNITLVIIACFTLMWEINKQDTNCVSSEVKER